MRLYSGKMREREIGDVLGMLPIFQFIYLCR